MNQETINQQINRLEDMHRRGVPMSIALHGGTHDDGSYHAPVPLHVIQIWQGRTKKRLKNTRDALRLSSGEQGRLSREAEWDRVRGRLDYR